jgi:hypothetical protein
MKLNYYYTLKLMEVHCVTFLPPLRGNVPCQTLSGIAETLLLVLMEKAVSELMGPEDEALWNSEGIFSLTDDLATRAHFNTRIHSLMGPLNFVLSPLVLGLRFQLPLLLSRLHRTIQHCPYHFSLSLFTFELLSDLHPFYY